MSNISAGNSRQPKDFRVLFLYPNIQMCALMPTGIALLSAMLKQEGFTVDLFDCTFYKNPLNINYPFYQSSLRPVKWEEKGVRFLESDLKSDFQKKGRRLWSGSRCRICCREHLLYRFTPC